MVDSENTRRADRRIQLPDLEPGADLTPYAGRWVALISGAVAGVGETPATAERLARRNRPREKPVLYFVESPDADPLPLSPLLERIRPLLLQQAMPVYLVGGAVRDALLNNTSHDLDFAAPRNAIKLAYAIADSLGLPAYVLDRERDTGRVVVPGEDITLDFARFRKGNLEADLCDRDFTVNAMALPATAQSRISLIDPCHGLPDLEAQLIRQTHSDALKVDPVRALRAVRLAVGLGFQLSADTAAAASETAAALHEASVERVRDEVLRVVQLGRVADGIRQMNDLGLLAATLPEVADLDGLKQSEPHHEPVLSHTMRVLQLLGGVEQAIVEGNPDDDPILTQVHLSLAPYSQQIRTHLYRRVDGDLSGRDLLRLGALFHDVGKAQTQRVDPDGRIRFFNHGQVGKTLTERRLRALRLSREAVQHTGSIVAGHMRPLLLAAEPVLSRRAVFRYFRACGSAGVDIGLLALADHLAIYGPGGQSERLLRLVAVVETLFRHYFQFHQDTVKPVPLLNGSELMEALRLQPGPEIGRLLRLIEEAQAAGEVTSREEALALAKSALG